MKKNIIFVLIFFSVLIVFFPFDTISAALAPRPLEIAYPPLPTIPPLTETVTLPSYVRYIYYFFLITGGVIALGVIISAGFRYLASAGAPEKLSDAKDQIASAVFGLLILFCSWLILRTINPQLVVLRMPEEIPPVLPDIAPGVYLCKERVDIIGFWDKRKTAEGQAPEEQKETVRELIGILETVKNNCYQVTTQGNIGEGYEDKITFVYLVPAFREQQYGVILYEEREFGGGGRILYGAKNPDEVKDLENPTEWFLPGDFLVSSAKPFILDYYPKPSWYVGLFQLIDFNRSDSTAEAKCWAVRTSSVPGCQSMDIEGEGAAGVSPTGLGPFKEIGSLKIEGDLIVVFFKEAGDWTLKTEIDVYAQSDTNLNNNLMGYWRPDCVEEREPVWEDRYYPCADNSMTVISGGTF